MKQRIVTGIIAGAMFLFFLYLGGVWFSGLILLLSLIGFSEFAKLNRLKMASLPGFFGILAIVFLVWPPQWGMAFDLDKGLWILLFAMMVLMVSSKNRIDLDQISLYFIGVVYIGFGFRFIVLTRLSEDGGGLFWTLFLFLVIWASDIGAYFTGRFWGKAPLIPLISPKKTWEGAVGGMVCSLFTAALFSAFAPDALSLEHALLLGVFISVIAQLGDLIQSAFKRIRGAKDTGTLLPGHGGVLDRCDSWLTVFPAVHVFSLLP